ncbi:hypothetical protein BE18_23205 [Sorangium cellulosum]|uniref:Uncharacterized protein n=1 Tax=Sorangium cellulosum TaxID=56 RepID=A0A150S3P8_SORCE|nr:hypothetical protein BE18_23205 [Sorangium cellulosum]
MKAGRREEKINDLPAFPPSCGLSPGKSEHYPLPKALTQIDAYLDGLSLDTGVVVIFDRRPGADPESGTRFEEALTPSGRRVTVLRA